MSKKIPEERLNRYRELDESDSSGSRNGSPEITEFLMRAYSEGAEFNYPTFNKCATFFGAPHTTDLTGVDIACVGIPMDITTPPERKGTDGGPNAVRKWSLNHSPIHNDFGGVIPFEMCNIVDYGDATFGLPEVSARSWVEGIHQMYSKFADAGVSTLTVGGEHTMTYPILKALGRDEPLAIIHIDAHADTGKAQEGGHGLEAEEFNDANVFRLAVLDGVIDPENTIQIGIRGTFQFIWQFSHDTGMRVVPMREFNEIGVENVLSEIRDVVGDRPIYLTVDADGLDPKDMPGVGVPEPDGITYHDMLKLVRGLRGMNIVGADLAEVNPTLDPQDQTVNNGAALIFEMLTLLAEARVKNKGGVKNKTHWNK